MKMIMKVKLERDKTDRVVSAPKDSVILNFDSINGDLYIWVLGDFSKEERVNHHYKLIKTDRLVSDSISHMTYIGSCWEWHLFYSVLGQDNIEGQGGVNE